MENKQLIHRLLDIGAVKINSRDFFTWTSGIQSPIYCDNRLTMSYPEVRSAVADTLVDMIHELQGGVDVIAGCATAGIPHAAWVAERLHLPMVYVRGTAKKHGRRNQIEGVAAEGSRVVVIEDLISTGRSSIQAADALREAGMEVAGILSIFTYGLAEAQTAFMEKGYQVQSIASYEDLLNELYSQGEMDDSQLEKLKVWRENPYVFTNA
ncbi:orotate phosphoribosyltransferase [Halobacillus litoralis]|uniref:Orotate phosphoribosyltransferase n=1 Tax=Halobacillus litoralis TaxID=45668 RepID=A0A845DNP3_9BACI|nr:orotate phosphoribosyltransferase [Halobacillus litoralis]MCA1023343.1 orotate phosphoribosyltransferase [Halobacillus litoralis]MYL19120.1 orotate phosphoribosyltransferase [Halobacillus litoralis]MYL37801.1 orotate phosphoribosyltransferase [Halobacillus litoralis]